MKELINKKLCVALTAIVFITVVIVIVPSGMAQEVEWKEVRERWEAVKGDLEGPDFIQPPQQYITLEKMLVEAGMAEQPIIMGPPPQPVSGTREILVILVELSDVAPDATHTVTYFEGRFFNTTPPSVRDYYTEVSYNTFTYVSGAVLGWYLSTYNQTQWIDNPRAVVIEAIQDADPFFNFAPYDTNGDSIVTNDELTIFIIVSGNRGGAFHWWTAASVATTDGVNIEGEFSATHEERHIGSYCHELGHDLGLPDLYDADPQPDGSTTTGLSEGIGNYGLMGGGSWTFSHMTAWSKIQLGWLTPTVVTVDGDFDVHDAETNAEAYVLIDPTHSTDEYFLVENRYPQNSYYETVGPPVAPSGTFPDEGILIYHIDETRVQDWINFGTNNVNVDETHKGVDVETAEHPTSHVVNADDLDEEANRGDADDLWDINEYNFNDISITCNATWYDGMPSGMDVTNFPLVSPTMNVHLSVNDSILEGLHWLHNHQNPDGSWSNDVGITSLAALAFLNAGYNETDPDVRDAIGYILSKVHGDGSIYTSSSYRTYQTSLAILPLVATHNDSYNTIIENAAQWLKDSQWDETCLWGSVNKDNWHYGGFGYGYSVRPDLSNSQFALMALDAVTSISKDDLLWDKAQVFLARDQMRQENVNIPDLGYEVVWNPAYNWNNDGGFVYYPGASLSGAGSYGSMTAAGIWSLRLCNVLTDDPRVQAAMDWHKGHYTWDQNPGMTPDGRRFQYYYYLAFSKALMMIVGEENFDGHDWYADLSAKLADLQHPDGHWVNTYTGHGSEGIPELCTAYSILALQVREIPTDIQRLSWLTFILHSNADLHVYDPLGRHVGMNYDTGEIEIEIPNATYSADPQNITIPELILGNYRIVLIGTGTGEYTLNVTGGVGNDTVSEDSYTGNITPGEVHESTVNVAMITWLTIHVEEPKPIDPIVLSATGTGNVSFITDAGTIEDLIALNESDMPEENPDIDFPHGLFRFNITGINPGQIVNITIAFPQDMPTPTQYWICGPNGSINNPQPVRWYEIPMNSNDGDNIITITKQDGGIGDEDGIANGVIVDDGGPGLPPVSERVPLLTPIGIIALAGGLAAVGVSRIRSRK